MSYNQNDFRLLIHSGIYVIANYCALIISMLALILYTPFITAEEFGIVGLVTLISNGMILIGSFGMTGAAFQFFIKLEDNLALRKKFFGTITIFLVTISLILLIFFEIFGNDFFRLLLSLDIFYPFIQLSLWTAFLTICFQLVPKQILLANQQSLAYSFLDSGSIVFSTILSLFFVIYLGQGALGIIIAKFLGILFFTASGIFILKKHSLLSFESSLIKEALHYSLPLTPYLISLWLLNMIPTALLANYTTLNELGIFSLTLTLATGFQVFTLGINKAFKPYYSQTNVNDPVSMRNLARRLTYNIYIIFILYLIISLGFEWVFLFVISEHYIQGAFLIYILNGAYLLNALFLIPLNIMSLTFGSTKKIPVLTIFSVSISILVSILLIPNYGITGAAISILISFLILLLVFLFISVKYYPIIWEKKRIIIFIIYFSFVIGFKFIVNPRNDSFMFLLFSLFLISTFVIFTIFQDFLTREKGKYHRLREYLHNIYHLKR